MDKYIVEIDGKNICSDSDGKSKLALSVKSDNGYAVFCTEIPLTPYTEPDMEQVRKEAYEKGRKDVETQFCSYDACKNRQEEYQRGLADAWEAARKIAYMYSEERNKIFGENLIQNIHDIYSASEAVEKIRQYEQEKEMDGLRQNIQTIVDQCGYSLDEIATVLKKMRGEQDG